MSQDVAQKQTSGLKQLLARLKEIDAILADTNDKLEFLATNSPSDEAKAEQESSSENATLEALHQVTDKISRKTSHISKSTNTIVGS